MGRHLNESLKLIQGAADEVRQEQWTWRSLRDRQQLRWRPLSSAEAERLSTGPAVAPAGWTMQTARRLAQ